MHACMCICVCMYLCVYICTQLYARISLCSAKKAGDVCLHDNWDWLVRIENEFMND